jgi:hypothetical protein
MADPPCSLYCMCLMWKLNVMCSKNICYCNVFKCISHILLSVIIWSHFFFWSLKCSILELQASSKIIIHSFLCGNNCCCTCSLHCFKLKTFSLVYLSAALEKVAIGWHCQIWKIWCFMKILLELYENCIWMLTEKCLRRNWLLKVGLYNIMWLDDSD